MADPRHRLGRSAEDAVAGWLTDAGWRVLARRWRARGRGELDIVCLDASGALVGVEVRARHGQRAGAASESVDWRRLRRMRATLAAYAAAEAPARWRGLRLDLVTAEADPAAAAWRLRRYPAIGGW
jgi:putative endonuclease